MSNPLLLDCWFLSGPTASGKTSVAIELARRLGAEIVSMDSMALYRHMDIGTAKPSPSQREAVPHHLIDLIEPHEEFSLAQYIEAAHRLVEEIKSRGRQALFVGGTPLYLKGLLRGIFEGPPADWPFRERLQQEAREHGSGVLHQRLAEVDPMSAERLHPNDERRLIRALEVYEKTGNPISEFQQQFETGRDADACRVFVLNWSREQLHARIDRRVDEMFAAGLVDEVQAVLDRPQPPSRTAGQAVGYREVIDHLQGKQDLPETVELVKNHTRQLARRQETWFRSLSECQFIPMNESSDPTPIVDQIMEAGQGAE